MFAHAHRGHDPASRSSDRPMSRPESVSYLFATSMMCVRGRANVTRGAVSAIALAALLIAGLALGDGRAGTGAEPTGATLRSDPRPLVRVWEIHYRAHDGLLRRAFLQLPTWYTPAHDPP